jgi:hypothetical protein
MAISGVTPSDHYPPGCSGPPERLVSDEVADLRRMLRPLAERPEVDLLLIMPHEPSGSSRVSALEDITTLPSDIVAVVQLELDPDCPHLDFVLGLQRLLWRLQTHPGFQG